MCVCLCIVVSNTVFLFCFPSSCVPLCCHFLCQLLIAPSLFSNVYYGMQVIFKTVNKFKNIYLRIENCQNKYYYCSKAISKMIWSCSFITKTGYLNSEKHLKHQKVVCNWGYWDGIFNLDTQISQHEFLNWVFMNFLTQYS